MVLIDALYINDGGGKVLLDYLIEKVEGNSVDVVFLLDKRCENRVECSRSHFVFLEANLKNRYLFYKKNKGKFSKILCFGNLPPLIKYRNAVVYTYFHQPMYLNIPIEFSVKMRFLFKLKQLFVVLTKDNTSYWLVQNSFIKRGLTDKYKVNVENVILSPFYRNEDLKAFSKVRESNSFIYVSNATPHKNHNRLIEAFCAFYDKYKEGKLILTIDIKYSDVLEFLIRKQNQGYPIVNIGFVGREELIMNYHQAEYLIFPSLEESFGLGIVEAIECGCKVIGANLPYMYQVCNPSINFDPFKKESIIHAFEQAINKEEKETEQKIFNEIDKLIFLLKN